MTSVIAKPESLEIDFQRAAIVVVDMQNAFAKDGGMLSLCGLDISAAEAVIKINEKLLAAARSAGVTIVYLAMSYHPDLTDAGDKHSPNYHKELGLKLMRERPEHAGKLLIEGTWDWQIIDELKPQASDIVINKPRYSGFVGTNLDSVLRNKDIRYLFLSGIATNICVESTGRDAFFREYWPILVEDAVNHAGPDYCADATKWNFENIFGWVTSSSEIIRALEQAAGDQE